MKLFTFTFIVLSFVPLCMAQEPTAEVEERGVFGALDPVLESRLGELWYKKQIQNSRISQNPKYQEIVDRVSGTILEAINDRPDLTDWRFTVVQDGSINAFSYPGGKILIHTGLIDFLTINGQTQEEMLASVIAHEMAHVTMRHGLQAIQNRASLDWVLANLDAVETKAANGKLSGQEEEKVFAIADARFTRIQEFEADQYGSLYSALAGYGYSGSIRYMQSMIEKEGDYYSDEYLKVRLHEGSYTAADHPTWTERIAGLKEFQKHLLNIAGEFNWGYQVLKNQNYDKAIHCFKDVVKIFPNFFQAWNNLGKAYHLKWMQQRKTEEVQFQIELEDYFINLREVLREPDLLKRTIECYRRAAQINRNVPGIQSNLAIALSQTGNKDDLDEAEEILNKLISKKTNRNEVYLNHLAVVLYRKNPENRNEILKLFQDAASQDYSPALYNLAILQLEMGLNKEGCGGLLKYLTADPASQWADQARNKLRAMKIEVPENQQKGNAQITGILHANLGSKKSEVVQDWGEPERIERATTTYEESGEILHYDSSGVHFILTEGKVVAIELSEAEKKKSIRQTPGLANIQPEIGGIEIGSGEKQLLEIFANSLVQSNLQEVPVTLGKMYSFDGKNVRANFHVQFSKVIKIEIREK